MSEPMLVVRRPDDHPKGGKLLTVIPYGKPVPPGIIIGKGAVITVESGDGKDAVRAAHPVSPDGFSLDGLEF